MPSTEDMEIDIAEAHGKAMAAICLLQSLMGVLHEKGILTHDDGAVVTAIADHVIDQASVPDDAKIMAKSAIKGFASAWTVRLTRN